MKKNQKRFAALLFAVLGTGILQCLQVRFLPAKVCKNKTMRKICYSSYKATCSLVTANKYSL